MAIELAPNFWTAYNSRGRARYTLGNVRKAIKDYDKAIELNPKNTEAYFLRATAYSKLGVGLQVREDLQAAARLGSKQAQDLLAAQGFNWTVETQRTEFQEFIRSLVPAATKAREAAVSHPKLSALSIELTINQALEKAKNVQKDSKDTSGAHAILNQLESTIGPLRTAPSWGLHTFLAELAEKDKKPDEQKYHEAFRFALGISLSKTGNGRSLETAMQVVCLSEEYVWLDMMKSLFQKQSRVAKYIEGKKYDIWTVKTTDGKEQFIYFDTSLMDESFLRELNAGKVHGESNTFDEDLQRILSSVSETASKEFSTQLADAIKSSDLLRSEINKATKAKTLQGIVVEEKSKIQDGRVGIFGGFVSGNNIVLTKEYLIALRDNRLFDVAYADDIRPNNTAFALAHLLFHLENPMNFTKFRNPIEASEVQISNEARAFIHGWNIMLNGAEQGNNMAKLSPRQQGQFLMNFRYRTVFVAAAQYKQAPLKFERSGEIKPDKNNINAIATTLGNSRLNDIE